MPIRICDVMQLGIKGCFCSWTPKHFPKFNEIHCAQAVWDYELGFTQNLMILNALGKDYITTTSMIRILK